MRDSLHSITLLVEIIGILNAGAHILLVQRNRGCTEYYEKMKKIVCLAGLTILMLLIKSSGGAILSLSTGFPSCQGSRLQETDQDIAGTLTFKFPLNYFCRWKVEKPTDAGEAVVLHVNKINIKGCPSTLQLPGMAKMCTRKEPFCHVYTSSGSYCTQSDVDQQVQASYSDCTTSQIHSGLTNMDLDYSPSGSRPGSKKFQIDFMRITCNNPPTTTISSSSAITAEISTTKKAPISPRIVTITPATTTKEILGNDMMTTDLPVAAPTSDEEYLITSGAKTTEASEITQGISNNIETGSESTKAGFSGIATSTNGREERKKMRMTEIEEWMKKNLGVFKDDAPDSRTFFKISGTCQSRTSYGSDESKTLTYLGSDEGLCRWKVAQQQDPNNALLLYVKELSKSGCTANLSLPGTRETCVRAEPYCHVYTSKNSYCTPEDVDHQVQDAYPICNISVIHQGLTNMELAYKTTGRKLRSFAIAFKKITCRKPSSSATASSSTTKFIADTTARAASPASHVTGSSASSETETQTSFKIIPIVPQSSTTAVTFPKIISVKLTETQTSLTVLEAGSQRSNNDTMTTATPLIFKITSAIQKLQEPTLRSSESVEITSDMQTSRSMHNFNSGEQSQERNGKNGFNASNRTLPVNATTDTSIKPPENDPNTDDMTWIITLVVVLVAVGVAGMIAIFVIHRQRQISKMEVPASD